MKLLDMPVRVCLNGMLIRRCATDCRKTALYQYHLQAGAKMVSFAGFSMPVQYKQSIKDSHLYTRSNASMFDVSHMLQTKVTGKDRIAFIESLTVADVKSMNDNQSVLSLFTNTSGGIEDDLIITRTENYLFLVSNAGRIDRDKELLEDQANKFRGDGREVIIEYLQDNYSLLALQGPLSQTILQKALKYDLSQQKFMTSRATEVLDIPNCRVTRCGYTGEDGFEISVPNQHVESVAQFLTECGVWLAGLGVRDSLRLEAGLCLYGNDIDEKTTPVEAGLVWTIGKGRRVAADFPGAGVILKQIKEKPKRKRIGLVALEAGAAARHGASIEWNGKPVGIVTSGCPSPSLSKNIAMAYVESTASVVGNQLHCVQRGKRVAHQVVKMPFVPSKYFV